MGNKGSSDSSPPATQTSASSQREENVYEPSPTARASHVSPATTTLPSSSAPSVSLPSLPRAHDRRSMTVVFRGYEREQRGGPITRRMSTSDTSTNSYSTHSSRDTTHISRDPIHSSRGSPHSSRDSTHISRDPIHSSRDSTHISQDDLQTHLVDQLPREGEEGVFLGATIAVVFDRDVKIINISKLFEVKCEGSSDPIKGRCMFDSRQQRAEFTPSTILFPHTSYTVHLMGRAVTTTQCSFSRNISDAQLHFTTCDPPPKNIGVKLKGQKGEVERLQIDKVMYYNLLSSLVGWCARTWGCSGEHILGLFVEAEERGKLHPLKADHDVLKLRENEIVVVDIKD